MVLQASKIQSYHIFEENCDMSGFFLPQKCSQTHSTYSPCSKGPYCWIKYKQKN